ncbi:MAG: hypothetical protein FJ224_07245 [Lentisphaerae bacterium]|nr:hypothetical protein [Lentisphaerota bacterium]
MKIRLFAPSGAAAARILLAAAFALSAGSVQAQVQGALIKRDRQRLEGVIQYDSSSGMYQIATPAARFSVSKDEIVDVDVPRPRQLDQSAALVQSGRGSEAVSVLKQIVAVYTGLKWDLPAARLLAEIQVKSNPDEALEMCQRIIRSNPAASMSPDFAPVYWEVLLAKNQRSTLETEIVKAVAQGDRNLSAAAQMKRGDLREKEGKYKEALVDGYLRIAYLFRDIRPMQPEALFKAAKCFERLGQQDFSDRMRKRLLAEFPDTEYAKRIVSGT